MLAHKSGSGPLPRSGIDDNGEETELLARVAAGEVDAFLDGLPVTAHRETFSERAGRLLRSSMALPLGAIVLLMLAYLIMRALVALFAGL